MDHKRKFIQYNVSLEVEATRTFQTNTWDGDNDDKPAAVQENLETNKALRRAALKIYVW